MLSFDTMDTTKRTKNINLVEVLAVTINSKNRNRNIRKFKLKGHTQGQKVANDKFFFLFDIFCLKRNLQSKN